MATPSLNCSFNESVAVDCFKGVIPTSGGIPTHFISSRTRRHRDFGVEALVGYLRFPQAAVPSGAQGGDLPTVRLLTEWERALICAAVDGT